VKFGGHGLSLLKVSLPEEPEAPAPDSIRDAAECTHGSVPHSPSGVPEDPAETEGLTTKEADFYRKLRRKIRHYLATRGPFRYADILLLAPDMFHVLCRLVADPRIPAFEKAKLGATLAYFISPIGLIPEGITGPIGYIDDVALAAYVLRSLLGSEHAHVVREHWAGDQDVLAAVQGVLAVVEGAIGGALWRRSRSPAPPGRPT
jgi:uncharacterized membrane protein YkvA (DUF1232 family)